MSRCGESGRFDGYSHGPTPRRRDFLKAMISAAIYSCGLTSIKADQAASAVAAKTGLSLETGGMVPAEGPVSYVRPRIGTGWHGHTFPGATAPFGLVQLSPDTAGPPEIKWIGWYDEYGWDHCSGYHYSDNVVKGFSHTHLSGTGAMDLGDVLLMPVVEGANWGWGADVPGKQHQAQIEALGRKSGWVGRGAAMGCASEFSHQDETMQAGYYRVYLKTPRVNAELTATTRCGMHRYTYSTSARHRRRGVLLDLVHGLGCKVYHAELNIESPVTISGVRSTHGWAADKQVYFVMEFSEAIADYAVWLDGHTTEHHRVLNQHFTGTRIKAIFRHASSREPLLVRVGISCTGIEGARKNLKAEIPHWNFDRIRHNAARVWNGVLTGIKADLPGPALAETFYSGCYHCMVAPATFNDADGTFRGEDHRNHPGAGFNNYTTLSIWDIYRGEFPLLMLAQPERTNDIIQSLLISYRQLHAHSLPVWPLWGNETWCMAGFHVVAMILGAYVRGFRGFDASAAYAAMFDTAMKGDAFTGRRKLQKSFRERGYISSGPRKSAVSATLDIAYDYWCVGAMAELLGKMDDARMFYGYGRNYRNLFDPATGFMRGKLPNGKWREPFVPDREYWSDYTESDAWQATFNVPQDVGGLIGLYGGDTPFAAKLDALFTSPSKTYNSPPDISGMIGQDAQANEPSNHIPYLYAFAGQPWKTQYWVRRMLALYNNTPAGIPGNDDCGQTSSCFVFGALGFYPVNPANGVYVIGSPLVNRATIRLPKSGTTFAIVAENNSPANVYIQSATLNGKPLFRSWIHHSEIHGGGELRFKMGAQANKEWAIAPADRPPSGLVLKS